MSSKATVSSAAQEAAQEVKAIMDRQGLTKAKLCRLLAGQRRLKGLGTGTLFRWISGGAASGWRIELLAAYLRERERNLGLRYEE